MVHHRKTEESKKTHDRMNAIIPLKRNRKITMRFERKTGYMKTGHKRNTPQTPVEHKTTGKKYNRSRCKTSIRHERKTGKTRIGHKEKKWKDKNRTQ